MNEFRDMKRQARRTLHEAMSDTVLYVPERGADPVTTTARIHDAFNDEGKLDGGGSGWAERAEITPKARFVDFTPKKDALIVTKDFGIWSIERTWPAHDISIDCDLIKLTPGQVTIEGLDASLPWGGLPAPVQS